MTNEAAQIIADMANKAEAEIISRMTDEQVLQYLAIPRSERIRLAFEAAEQAAKVLAA